METLSSADICRVIEGRGAASRVPLVYDHWIYANAFGDDEAARDRWLSQFPQDVERFQLNIPDLLTAPADDPNYRWTGVDLDAAEDAGLDNRPLIEDWDSEAAERFFETFPNPDYPGLVPDFQGDGKRYVLARWWFCFFERHWSIRGMENALMDYFLYPDQVHKLFQKLADFYCRAMERTCARHHVDGFFVSDDLGTQHAPFLPLDVFQTFFKPYYKQVIDKAHSLGCHMWLHTCGNIQLFLPDFIEIGLDVIHPIQKYTMDEAEIARLFGDQICIWAGFDVQRMISHGTPEEVRGEVRRLIDTYWRPDGHFMLTMGNGSTPDWKLDCLQALYEESLRYGRNRSGSGQ